MYITDICLDTDFNGDVPAPEDLNNMNSRLDAMISVPSFTINSKMVEAQATEAMLGPGGPFQFIFPFHQQVPRSEKFIFFEPQVFLT